MSETPNLNQQRITRQMDEVLKTARDPMGELWSMWKRHGRDDADSFVVVLIGQLVSVRALAKLREERA